MCTRGGVEVEVQAFCLGYQFSKAVHHRKLLPAVEDGSAALIVQLQMGKGKFSSRGLKE